MPALAAGDKLGPYEIIALLGAGGMGEVYRAHDPRLGRDVAIKVSAERFSERFEREARAVAALNHPNICQLYDVGPNYLVMELVEGEPPQGPLPLETALAHARQIADALEAAHEKAIVHRDLKPANIKIKSDGVVKVLDFGLAKVTGPQVASSENSPTLSMAATQAGVILGTAAYMAPEQAKGRPVDKRADIWAFGVVLYEMLTGHRLFQGEDVTETLAAVVMKQPEWHNVPPSVQPLLRRCLQKDPKNRLRDIGDAMALVVDAPSPAGPVPAAPASWLWPGLAALFVLTTVALGFLHFREQPPTLPETVRFQVQPAGSLAFASPFSVSPDGRKLVYAAQGPDGGTRLWLRALDSIDARPLPGTETGPGIPPPFWSPDSRYVAFDAQGKLKRVDVTGGPAQTLCDVGAAVLSGSWNRDGVVIFALNGGSVMRVSAEGGVASPLTVLNASRSEASHAFPDFLPDGRHFLYLSISTVPENSGIYVGSLDAQPAEQGARKLASTVYGAVYAPPSTSGQLGHLLFQREGTLMAQTFNERKLELQGEAVPIAEQLGSYLAHGFFSASANGTLVYRTGAGQYQQLTWFDRQGKPLGTFGESGVYSGGLALSPDNKHAAVSRLDYQTVAQDLWLLDFARGTSTRFTFGKRMATAPVWSPDGTRIVYRWDLDGVNNLYVKLASGAKDPEELVKSKESKTPTSWSRDGKYLLYSSSNPKTRSDVWVFSFEDRKSTPLLRTEFNEFDARLSPDGRWFAYISNESGRNEVYVRPFVPPSGGASGAAEGQWMVSKDGGAFPSWQPDGKGLTYLNADGKLMTVEITAATTGIQAGTPRLLFQPPRGIGAAAIAADGRVLLPVPVEIGLQTPFTVVLNWQSALKK